MKRNPWKWLRFQPLEKPVNFKSFFKASDGWGSLSQVQQGAAQKTEVTVVSGHVAVKQLHLAAAFVPSKAKAALGSRAVTGSLIHTADGVLLAFAEPVVVTEGHPLTVHLS